MEQIRSLADQLRDELEKKKDPKAVAAPVQERKKENGKKPEPDILKAIRAYDNADHKSMVHVRFDAKTADTMAKFKMATNVDVTKFVAFAVRYLFDSQPELKAIIKQFIQNTEL
ncbi:hypothetical protein [Mucilaginibacter sp. SJ]|uniref:hypothetical protein n=1 Tax=Mucilaginibacter sp. SJ TaxID=3029053 RepID=UPI0023A97434|nr:hypothetical protein [Mucilaginibacter sp. SJ]WEA01734.1 hypothetical protein MusilaSJ_02210 [Mucilaginibacter sp. SJ]